MPSVSVIITDDYGVSTPVSLFGNDDDRGGDDAGAMSAFSGLNGRLSVVQSRRHRRRRCNRFNHDGDKGVLEATKSGGECGPLEELTAAADNKDFNKEEEAGNNSGPIGRPLHSSVENEEDVGKRRLSSANKALYDNRTRGVTTAEPPQQRPQQQQQQQQGRYQQLGHQDRAFHVVVPGSINSENCGGGGGNEAASAVTILCPDSSSSTSSFSPSTQTFSPFPFYSTLSPSPIVPQRTFPTISLPESGCNAERSVVKKKTRFNEPEKDNVADQGNWQKNFQSDYEEDDDGRTAVTTINSRLQASLFREFANKNNFEPFSKNFPWRRASLDDRKMTTTTCGDNRTASTRDANRGNEDDDVPEGIGRRFMRKPETTANGRHKPSLCRKRSQSLQHGSDDEAASVLTNLLPSETFRQHRNSTPNHHPIPVPSSNHHASSLMNVNEDTPSSTSSTYYAAPGVPIALAIPGGGGGGIAIRSMARRRSSAYITHSLMTNSGTLSASGIPCQCARALTTASGASLTGSAAPCTKRCCVARVSIGSYYGSTDLLTADDIHKFGDWECGAETPPQEAPPWIFGG